MRILLNLRRFPTLLSLTAAAAWLAASALHGAPKPQVIARPAVPAPPQTPVAGGRGGDNPAGLQMAPKGTGVILGQVVDGVTGRPVSGAIVSFNGVATGPAQGSPGAQTGVTLSMTINGVNITSGGSGLSVASQRVMVDTEGRFTFRDLPKGTYSFSASATGYSGGSYGQRAPQGPGRPYELGDGERAGDLKLLIWKYATLSGAVLDETGDPVVGVMVRALRRNIANGRTRLSTVGNTQTDDRGAYRFSGLLPGDYLVGITTTQTTMPVSVENAYQEAMRPPPPQPGQPPQPMTPNNQPEIVRSLQSSGAPSIGSSGFRVGDFILQQSSYGGRAITAPAPGDDGRLSVYAATFYPTASVTSQAAPIRLAVGEDRAGLDLHLRLVPSFRVSGTVIGPDGPGANLGLHLVPSVGGGESALDNSFDAATTACDGNGAFTFLGVPPGQYVVRVQKIPRPVPPPPPPAPMATLGGRGAAISVPPLPPALPSEPTLWGEAPASVTDADVTGVSLSLRTGLKVSGQFQFDGTSPRPTADVLQRASVSLSSLDPLMGGGFVPGRATAQGQFTTMGYPPGRYIVTASLPASGWIFKSAMAGGRDVSDVPLELDASDVGGVMITFTDRPIQLSGTVHDPRNPTNVDSTVVIFPAAYQAWIDNGMIGRRWRTNRTGKTGNFTFSLPAGEYLIVAITDDPGRDAFDGRYFVALAGLATHVSLADGDKKVQDLTAVKSPTPGGLPPAAQVEPRPRPHGPFVADDDQVPPPATPPTPPPQPRPAESGIRGGGPGSQQVQPPRDTLLKPLIGTASLTGTVVTDDSSSRPLRRAVVTLSGGGLRQGRPAVTDDTGHFAFTKLPAGSFTLQVQKPAYIGTYYGQKKSSQPPTAIKLTEGQNSEVTVRMPRGAVITGRLVGADGQPVQNVQVQVLQFRMQNGEKTLQQTGSYGNYGTDDRGVYRIFGLPAGDYLVVASARGTVGNDVRRTSDADIRWAQAAVRQSAAGTVSTPSSAPSPAPAAQSIGYASVFFPGTTDASGAATLTVAAGEERSGVDFNLQLVPTAKVSGTVTGGEGSVIQSVQLSLLPKNGSPALARFLPTQGMSARMPEGTFSMSGVTPGEYVLSARTTAPPQPAPMPAGGPGPPVVRPPAQQSLWALAEIVVAGQDITDVALQLQRGMTITGRVAFDGKVLQPPQDLTKVRVQLAQANEGATAYYTFNTSTPPAVVDQTGAFVFESVLPGRYRLSGSAPAFEPGAPRPPGPPVSWWLRSAVVNGRDVLDSPLSVLPSENLTGAVMTFTDQITEISGSLTDQTGKPATDYWVVVFSTDRTFWSPSSRRVTRTRPTLEGKFRIGSLPPGEYYMAALTELDPNELNDPSFLEQIVAASFKISLSEGEKKVQDLRLKFVAGGLQPAGLKASSSASR